MTTTRKVRVLITSDGGNDLKILQKLLTANGFVVRTTKTRQEFRDIVSRPDCDFGVAIIVSESAESAKLELNPTKPILIRSYPGRLNVTRLFEQIEKDINSLGRY